MNRPREEASLLRRVLSYAPGSLAPTALTLASTFIYTRVFSTEGYGRYTVVWSLVILLATLGSQWVEQSVNRYLPAAGNAQERAAILKGLGAAARVILMMGGIVGLAVLAAQQALAPVWRPFMAAGVFAAVLFGLFNAMLVVLQAEMRAREHTLFRLADASGRFILTLGLVFLVRKAPDALIWGSFAGTLIVMPLLWTRAHVPAPWARSSHAAREQLRRFAGYGLPFIGWFFCTGLLSYSDRYIIQVFQDASQVGIYAANYSMVGGVTGLMAAPFLLAFHPHLMQAWARRDSAEVGGILAQIAEWYLLVGTLLVGFVWLFSREAATLLLGSAFREGHRVMPVVLAGSLLWSLAMYTHKPLEFAERTRLMLVVAAGCAALNVMLNLLLVPIYGYMAAAFNTLAAYLAYNLTVTVLGRGVVSWRVNWRRVAPGLLVGIAGVLGIGFLKEKIAAGEVLRIGLSLAAFLLVALLVLVAAGHGSAIKALFHKVVYDRS